MQMESAGGNIPIFTYLQEVDQDFSFLNKIWNSEMCLILSFQEHFIYAVKNKEMPSCNPAF